MKQSLNRKNTTMTNFKILSYLKKSIHAQLYGPFQTSLHTSFAYYLNILLNFVEQQSFSSD